MEVLLESHICFQKRRFLRISFFIELILRLATLGFNPLIIIPVFWSIFAVLSLYKEMWTDWIRSWKEGGYEGCCPPLSMGKSPPGVKHSKTTFRCSHYLFYCANNFLSDDISCILQGFECLDGPHFLTWHPVSKKGPLVGLHANWEPCLLLSPS